MIYFDNAATTFPKPECVYRETERCLRSYCGNPGRGSHKLSVRAEEKIFECRELIARFFGSARPENVVFTMNATYALNISIKALAPERGSILISDAEHNSVIRPVALLEKKEGIRCDVFPAIGKSDNEIISSFKKALSPDTGLVVMTAVSNITGQALPVREIGELCRTHGIKFICDASQCAGTHPLDIKWGIDVICAPAHKGLYGIQGGGFALFSDAYAENGEAAKLPELISGGSGINSLDPFMPEFLPERYEAGTLPTPAAAALCEGIKTVMSLTPEAIFAREAALERRMREAMSSIPGLILYGANAPSSMLLFNIEGISAPETAAILDKNGICARAGFHCAPLAHKALNTGTSGAVRLSFSMFNTQNEAEKTLRVIKNICRGR